MLHWSQSGKIKISFSCYIAIRAWIKAFTSPEITWSLHKTWGHIYHHSNTTINWWFVFYIQIYVKVWWEGLIKGTVMTSRQLQCDRQWTVTIIRYSQLHVYVQDIWVVNDVNKPFITEVNLPPVAVHFYLLYSNRKTLTDRWLRSPTPTELRPDSDLQ